MLDAALLSYPRLVRSQLMSRLQLKYEPLELGIKHVLNRFKDSFGFDLARMADLLKLVGESPEASQTLKGMRVLAGERGARVCVQE